MEISVSIGRKPGAPTIAQHPCVGHGLVRLEAAWTHSGWLSPLSFVLCKGGAPRSCAGHGPMCVELTRALGGRDSFLSRGWRANARGRRNERILNDSAEGNCGLRGLREKP